MNEALREGIHLFNTEKFFEAHEALESIWLKAEGEEKMFLHGLIQVAAAFHHLHRGNLSGFESLLEKGSRKLENSGKAWGGIQLGGLLLQLKPWREWARHARPLRAENSSPVNSRKRPPLPKINS